MITRSRPLAASIALSVLALCARADIRLPAVLSDHMVLQQKANAKIWGWATPGEKVTVTASWPDAKGEAVTDNKGNWLVHLPPPRRRRPLHRQCRGQHGYHIAKRDGRRGLGLLRPI